MPLTNSRFEFSEVIIDPDGNKIVTPPVPIPPQMLKDSRTHVVQQGETLFSIAWLEYMDLLDQRADIRPSGFWWVIGLANGIVDATYDPEPGTKLIVPSLNSLLRIITERGSVSTV